MRITPEAIRKARSALNESQSEFAARMELDQATVSRWENGALPKHGWPQVLLRFVLGEVERTINQRG